MTTQQQMQTILNKYFEAWRNQDSDALVALFAHDGIYKVKPFTIEEYHGQDAIREYWDAHPVAKQHNPQPQCLAVGFGENVCFAEWVNKYTTHEGTPRTTRGMLLMEFSEGLVTELREHYLSLDGDLL